MTDNEPKDSDADSQDTTASKNVVRDEEVRQKLDRGDKEKIDAVLEELEVTHSSDDPDEPDTEGSNSSRKNLDRDA